MGFAPFHPDTGWAHVLGSFVEKDCGHTFEFSRNDEMVKQLEEEIEQAKNDHKYWTSTTPDKQFLKDLEELA
jgi:hypothetical protein